MIAVLGTGGMLAWALAVVMLLIVVIAILDAADKYQCNKRRRDAFDAVQRRHESRRTFEDALKEGRR